MKRLLTLLLLLGTVTCALAQRTKTIVYINGAKYYIHNVQAGETLYSLSRIYEVGEKVIIDNNPTLSNGLKCGENIKIPYVSEVTEKVSAKKLRKTFDTHFVSKGETLYAISRQYEIPIQTIIADNKDLDPIHLRLGQRILIRKKKIGSEDEAGSKAQWEEYRNSLNSVSQDGIEYHIVAPGETFYSLSHRFGITEEELSRLNDGLKSQDLKAGAMIKVPGKKTGIGEEGQADSTQIAGGEDFFADQKVEEVEFRALRRSQKLNIALLLPLSTKRGPNANYLEFYQGFLMALDSVKSRYGVSMEVNLFNTERNPEMVDSITRDAKFQKAHLIVGPIYEQGLYPVIKFAEEHKVPVISPLAHIEKMNSDVLFQLAPDPQAKYEKVADLLKEERQITLIYTGKTDKDFEQEVLTLLGDREYRRHMYRYEHPNDIAKRGENAPASPADLTPYLDNDKENLFIIMADNEIDVDRILAALASADTGLASRGRVKPQFAVLGNTRWNRYNNIDRTMFFKDRVVFISTYHAKRDCKNVENFDSSYIRNFGMLPTLYSYRGYDTAMIFAPAMYNDIEYDMEGRRYAPLQTEYIFGQKEGRHNHINRNWTRVNYNADFTITIE